MRVNFNLKDFTLSQKVYLILGVGLSILIFLNDPGDIIVSAGILLIAIVFIVLSQEHSLKILINLILILFTLFILISLVMIGNLYDFEIGLFKNKNGLHKNQVESVP